MFRCICTLGISNVQFETFGRLESSLFFFSYADLAITSFPIPTQRKKKKKITPDDNGEDHLDGN